MPRDKPCRWRRKGRTACSPYRRPRPAAWTGSWHGDQAAAAGQTSALLKATQALGDGRMGGIGRLTWSLYKHLYSCSQGKQTDKMWQVKSGCSNFLRIKTYVDGSCSIGQPLEGEVMRDQRFCYAQGNCALFPFIHPPCSLPKAMSEPVKVTPPMYVPR
jgi:hypothetical protein